MRLPVALAALALLCASLAVAILFARFLQRGGAGELARLVAERGTVDRQLGRVRDAGTPAESDAGVELAFGPDGLPTSESAEDPQRAASRRSFHGGDAGVGAIPFQETWVRGHVVSIDGQATTHAGAECWVRVLPVGTGGYNCLVRVMCEGALLYPDSAQQAGYAPCDVEDGRVVSGSDTSTSGRDGDPTIHLDFAHHQLEVRDATPQLGDAYFEQLGASGIPTFAAEIALDPPA